jgi:hypothetical protein
MRRPVTVEIPAPCPMDWASMRGDDRRRFCDACSRHVHDLSACTREEAERLLEATDGDLCAAISFDASGRMIHRPSFARMGARLAAALSVAGLLQACEPAAASAPDAGPPALPGKTEEEPIRKVGKVRVQPEPDPDEKPPVPPTPRRPRTP